MTKKKLIGFLIMLVLITFIVILFSFVFCVREQEVSIAHGNTITIGKSEILSAANIKEGSPIFMIDKEKATQNIENKFPYIKVIQIKTTGLRKINIIVRTRVKLYYTQYNNDYYMFDEDMKLLEISHDRPINLIQIEEGLLNITDETKECDFVGTAKQKDVLLNLYKAMTTTVSKGEGENKTYLNREDICNVLKNVSFEEYETFDKIIITTTYGVKLDIETPVKDLDYKINICFSTINGFIENANNYEKSGTIKLFYNLNDELECKYFEI